MKLKYYILICLLSIPILIYGKASLFVLDKNKTPLAGAVVSLISKQDSIIMDAGITDANGHVFLEIGNSSNLRLSVRCLGFDDFDEDYSSSSNTVVLSESATKLSEVVITADPQMLIRKSNRFEFTPGTLKKEVANSYELLKLTPLIEVNKGYFSIIGKGNTQIQINGRNPQMDANALVEMLNALPAEQIKKVEIITTPGSAYSASDNGGIINVIVEHPTDGYIGSVSARSDYYNKRVSPLVSIWNGYSCGKLNLSLSASYSGGSTNQVHENNYEYTDLNRYVTNLTTISGWSNGLSARLNAQYSFSKRSTLGFAVNLSMSQSDAKSNISSKTIEGEEQSASTALIKKISPWQRPNYGFQGFFTFDTDDKGSRFDITVDYTSYLSVVENIYNFGGREELQDTKVTGRGLRVKSKYKFSINNNHDINFGYELFHSVIDNNFNAKTNSNFFCYKEMINSGHIEWNAQWSNAFSTTAGLRVENSDISGEQLVSADNFTQKYTDFIPSLSFGIELPGRGAQNLSFSVSRYIYRPFYSLLNPFVNWTSETTSQKGNINLRPSYEWEFSFYYSFLKDFVYGATYVLSDDVVMDYTYQEDDITVSSARNFGGSKDFRMFISYNHVFGGFWRIKSDAQLSYSSFDAWLEDHNLSRHSMNYSFSIFNSVVVSKKDAIRLQFAYSFYSPVKQITNNGRFKNLLSVSIFKSFHNGLHLSLEASNLLGYKNDSHYTSANYSYKEQSLMYPIQVSFKINYVFGKKRVSGAEDRYNSALDNRFK